MLALWILVGCKAVEPAPTEVVDAVDTLWQAAELGTDEQLAEALRDLAATFPLDPPDGSFPPLTDDDIAQVGVTGQDPADAPGLFMSYTFGCDRAELEASLSHPDQATLHPSAHYETYDRRFDSPRDAWLAGDDDVLTWEVDYSIKYLGNNYSASTESLLRRVPHLDDEQTPWGSFLVQRTYFPHPAEFDGDNNKYFEQDYQLEIFWFDQGITRHFYALWREFNFGGTYKSGNETAERLLLNALYDWDDETEEGCREGLP
jgi:hypothetical protein